MKKNIFTHLRASFTAFLILLSSLSANAHPPITLTIPPNMDFEFGDFTFWMLYDGIGPGMVANGWPQSIVGGTPPTNLWGLPKVLPTPNRHTITNPTMGNDPNCGFPVVAPFPGNGFSARLGEIGVSGYGAEKMEFYVSVPLGVNNYSIEFQYAVVFQDPGHVNTTPPNQYNGQPRFTVSVRDANTGTSVANGCYDLNYVAAQGIPGFMSIPGQSAAYYKPWTPAIINLSGLAGQTVIVEVLSADCAAGGHWGYAYFDVTGVTQYKPAVASCDLDGQGVVLSAPGGFMSYAWYDYTNTLIGTTQNMVDTPTNLVAQPYHVIVTPYPSISPCPDTLYTDPIANVAVFATPDTSCLQPGNEVQLAANAQGGHLGLRYEWTEFNTPGNTLSCTTCENPKANTTGTSFYTVKVTDSNGCFRTDTLQIYSSYFKPDAGNSFTTCVGTPVTFNGSVSPSSSLYQYNWAPDAPNPDLPSSNVLNPQYIPTTPGTWTYTLTVDSIACSKSDTMSITVLPGTITILDTTICKGSSFPILGTGGHPDPHFTYSWSPTIGVADPTKLNTIITTDTSRTYTVTASYPTCPTIVETFQVDVEPTPELDLGPDLDKCQWEDLFITSSVTPSWYPSYIYEWTPIPAGGLSSLSDPNVTFTGMQDALLKLKVSTPVAKCSDSDTVIVVVHPGNFASITPTDIAVCPNNPVNLVITGGATYRWDPPTYINDTTSGNVLSTPVTDIDYTVYVEDQYGCDDTLFASIDIRSDAVLDAGEDVTIYPGDTVEMNPRGNVSYYQWFPSEGLSDPTISNPLASPQVNTTYSVTGTTEYGCEVVDSVSVYVSTESMLEVPNAFTPGNSGPNNTIKVIRRGDAQLKYFRIFDRWGNMVFESTDIDEGWDGKYKGTPQPMGVYVYIVEAVAEDGTANGKAFYKKGNITLIR